MPVTNITELIPQRPPFIMVDELLYADEKKAEACFAIQKDNVLTKDGVFTEAGIIENIAQTAAMHAGQMALSRGEESPRGMIGGIKEMVIYRLPLAGDKINTTIELENEVFNARIVKGSIMLGEEKIAEGELRVFLF